MAPHPTLGPQGLQLEGVLLLSSESVSGIGEGYCQRLGTSGLLLRVAGF